MVNSVSVIARTVARGIDATQNPESGFFAMLRTSEFGGGG